MGSLVAPSLRGDRPEFDRIPVGTHAVTPAAVQQLSIERRGLGQNGILLLLVHAGQAAAMCSFVSQRVKLRHLAAVFLPVPERATDHLRGADAHFPALRHLFTFAADGDFERQRQIENAIVAVRPGSPRLARYQQQILAALSPAETEAWRRAVARADCEGTYFVAQPFHCAVGTKLP